jgi:hypothetical protein
MAMIKYNTIKLQQKPAWPTPTLAAMDAYFRVSSEGCVYTNVCVRACVRACLHT